MSIDTWDCKVFFTGNQLYLMSLWNYACTVPLTSNLSVHTCPLASDSKAARVRRPRYSRVNIHAHASAMRVTCVCARVTSTRSTRERVSIASIPRPLPPRKKVEGLGTRLACLLRVNLVHAFERERVHVRVLACTRASTRVCVFEYSRATRARHVRAVKLLVSGTVPVDYALLNYMYQ